MTITVAQITSLANEVKAKTIDLQSRLDAIQEQLDALYEADPTPSDAMDTFNELVEERDAISEEWNSYSGYSELLDLYAQANSSVKTNPAVEEALFDDDPDDLGVQARATELVNFARSQKNGDEEGEASFVTVKEKIEEAEQGDAETDNTGSSPEDGDNTPNEDLGNNTQTTPEFPSDGTSPARRLKNPLGWFSSYTYQISLYMVSPQGYTEFVGNGKRALPTAGQYYIIAQSGGVKKDKRPPGSPYDFYIDNVRMSAAVGISENQSQTFTQNIDFTIMEPYGFTFVSKLKDAAEDLLKANQNQAGDYDEIKNDTKQLFIIGIRFFGYDSNGNIMSAANSYDGRTLDPAYNQTTSQGLFERYFDVRIQEFKFNIDGRAVTYNIKTTALGPSEAAGIKRGMADDPITLEGTTVEDMLTDLMKKLNTIQDKRKEGNEKYQKTEYNVLFDNIPGADKIFTATMVTPEDKEKSQWPNAKTKNSQDSNESVSVKAVPDSTKRQMQFRRSTPILQIINQIILQSSYLGDALNLVYKSKLEPAENENQNELKVNTKQSVAWYNCTPELTNPRWDSTTSDWAYDISYIIKPYETPVNSSAYANKGTNYPGPFKRYDYWYTGENSEIIQYSQTQDNTFFNVALNPEVSKNGKGQGGNADIPNVMGKPQTYNTMGKLDKGLQAQANYTTNISDPGAVAKAKITILGDPDYLMDPSESSQGLGEEFRKYFGVDGFTINPTSGQIFIEVDFKQAVDYDTNLGFLVLNDNLVFWDYPARIKKIVKGISYRVNSVQSTFNGGKFTQTLDCVLNTFDDAEPEPDKDRTTE